MALVSALEARRGSGAHCASKAAVLQLTRVLAAEFGIRGILVNSTASGYIDTEMMRSAFDGLLALERALESVPLHQVCSAEEVFGPLLFRLSEGARYVTGHSITLDGGSSIL